MIKKTLIFYGLKNVDLYKFLGLKKSASESQIILATNKGIIVNYPGKPNFGPKKFRQYLGIK